MIVLAKLISGMTVIGDSDGSDISNALQIQIMSNPQNPDQFNVMLLPVFAPMSEDKVFFSEDKVLTVIKAPDNLEKEYLRITTGIIMSTANDLKNLNKVRPIFGAKDGK